MSGPDFAGLLKEHKEKEAKAVLRAAGGDLGSVSCRDRKNKKKLLSVPLLGAVLILGVLRYFKEHFLAKPSNITQEGWLVTRPEFIFRQILLSACFK